MIDQSNVERFNEIYKNTYHSTMRFIICKCPNINDANDILQETYLEVYKLLIKKDITNINLEIYVIKIASYKIKKHYSLLQRLRYTNLISKCSNENNVIDYIQDAMDIEEIISNESLCEEIWKFIKNKNGLIQKIFYLRFSLELSIKEMALELGVSESCIKNNLYRTMREIKTCFGKDEMR